jgi:putative DNA-invertase from lambdoid prophage Rac
MNRTKWHVWVNTPKKAGYKIAGVWKETASGAKDDRAERKEVLALAQARKIDVILVTELTRWGRSMLDFFHTLQDLQAWGVSLVAQTGLQFDLRSAQSKLIASLMAALADNAERGFMQSHTAGAAA